MLPVVFLFLFVFGCVAAFGYKHYVRPGLMLDQLASSTSDAIPYQIRSHERTGAHTPLAKFMQQVGTLLPVSPQNAKVVRRQLVAAGFRSTSAVAVYHGSKITLAVLFVFGAFVLRERIDNPLYRLAFPIAACGIGYIAPAFILGKRVAARHQAIRLSLPDVLDLLVICTEAGCGLDQAILNVSRELKSVHPVLSEELSTVNMEIMAGKTRAEALRNLAKRTGEEEIKKLVAILIQTDRFGTSVAEALRTQSDFLRVRRKQIAEEKAGKVGVKLVFPIFFFCMPSLVVVTAGPGMLQLFEGFASIK